MKILVFTPAGHPPGAAATLPDLPGTQPDYYQRPGTPPVASVSLHAKGMMLSWLEWAQHLVSQSPSYGGSWSLEDVPDKWGKRPDLLHQALAQADRKQSLA